MKKILAILLCVATLIGAACVSASAVTFNSKTAAKFGDLDDNGKVDAVDLYLLRSNIVGKHIEYNPVAADFDGDQSVTAADAVTL